MRPRNPFSRHQPSRGASSDTRSSRQAGYWFHQPSTGQSDDGFSDEPRRSHAGRRDAWVRDTASAALSGLPDFCPPTLFLRRRGMWSNSKRIELTIAGLVALSAFAPDATAQLQGPGQGLPQVQSEGTKPSPMRDFEQMIEAQRSQMHSRVTEAAERVQNACRTELQNFCSTVTPGEGRLLLSMQAHEDKLGNQCELALFEASRNVRQAMRRIERVADACGSDIQAHCVGSASIAQCMS